VPAANTYTSARGASVNPLTRQADRSVMPRKKGLSREKKPEEAPVTAARTSRGG